MSSYVKKLNNNVKKLSCSYLNDIIKEAEKLKIIVKGYTKIDTDDKLLWNVDTDTNNDVTDWIYNDIDIRTKITNQRYQIYRIIYKWYRNQKSAMNEEVKEVDTDKKNLHFSLHLYVIGMSLGATKIEFFNMSDYVKDSNGNVSEFVQETNANFNGQNSSYFKNEEESPKKLLSDIDTFINGINSIISLLKSLGIDNIIEEENVTTTVEENTSEKNEVPKEPIQEIEKSDECEPCKINDETTNLVPTNSVFNYSNFKNIFPCDIVFVSACHTNNFFNGTFDCPYRSFECAIANVPSNGTIVLFPGTYTINKTLNLPNKSISFSRSHKSFSATD